MAVYELFQTQGVWHRTQVETSPASAECPHCCRVGVFSPLVAVQEVGGNIRPRKSAILCTCPASDCRGLVIVFIADQAQEIQMFPSVIPTFETDGVAASIASCLQEAALCYSQQCWRAAAIMLRRTLEAICKEFGATGNTLHLRLQSLRQTVALSDTLFQAMDVLKLLGNDAAHIESRTFDQIDRQEVEVAMELTREVIRVLYKHQALVNQLNSLKRQP